MMTMTPVKESVFGETKPHWEPYHYRALGRDSQQRREYKSEWAFEKEFTDEKMTNRGLAEYLAFVSSDKWFTDRFGKMEFGMQFSGRRRKRACCSYRGATKSFTLKFPANGSMNYRLTGLHEMMHIVCHRQSHGAIFCAVLLQVVMHYMGTEAGRMLRRQFVLNSVSFRP
jgi:putative metallohydrolase (TIGR04338 family)